jgi:hypothetical protein
MRSTLLILLPAMALADTVTMTDGTFLRGQILRIADGVLEMRVPSLGNNTTQSVALKSVESFHTDGAVVISSGGVVQRGLAAAAGGRVASSGGPETSPLDSHLELWRDPSLRPAETAGLRKWTSQADIDLSGRSGVIHGSGYCTGYAAKGVTKADTINAGVRFTRAESGNQVSADDLHATFSYETNPTDVVFWYLRTDSGFDNARQIDFFSVNAAGLGFRLFTDGRGKLDARAGLAHRLERYASSANPNLSTPSADFGLVLTRELGWASLDSSLNLVPSFQSAGDLYLRHETSLSILRSAGPLSLKLGVSNDFRSKPLPTQVRLDTAYFLRTTYVWK